MSITSNLKTLQNSFQKLSRTDVTLVAVTKKHTASDIHTLLKLGNIHIGENRLAEWQAKHTELRSLIANSLPDLASVDRDLHPVYHYLAPLQSGSARSLAKYFSYFHGVSSFSALAVLLKSCARQQKIEETQLKTCRLDQRSWPLHYFIQLRLTDEPSKHGMSIEEFRNLTDYPENTSLRFAGLMTMGPQDADPSQTQEVFHQLRELRDIYAPTKKLSIGTSQDWELALEQGSDFLRLGSILFR